MLRKLLVGLVVLSGCADVATMVNIAPSAEAHADRVSDAVERLNTELGAEVFALRVVHSEERVDGQIIVRGVGDMGERVRGQCRRTRKGVIVRIVPETTDLQMAHELGHAAGLGHSSDPGNLMYPEAQRWGLTMEQRLRMVESSAQ